jgi:hypothetical protein
VSTADETAVTPDSKWLKKRGVQSARRRVAGWKSTRAAKRDGMPAYLIGRRRSGRTSERVTKVPTPALRPTSRRANAEDQRDVTYQAHCKSQLISRPAPLFELAAPSLPHQLWLPLSSTLSRLPQAWDVHALEVECGSNRALAANSSSNAFGADAAGAFRRLGDIAPAASGISVGAPSAAASIFSFQDKAPSVDAWR